jgi:uncharacterized membrane protein YraQ (UPF0718 family)
MAASWRVNLFLGIISFLFTYLFSIENNTWQMSLFRAGIGFLLFFLLGYILRFLLHQIAAKKSTSLLEELNKEEISGQNKIQNDVENGQSDDPSFQAITLGALHNGDNIKKPEDHGGI